MRDCVEILSPPIATRGSAAALSPPSTCSQRILSREMATTLVNASTCRVSTSAGPCMVSRVALARPNPFTGFGRKRAHTGLRKMIWGGLVRFRSLCCAHKPLLSGPGQTLVALDRLDPAASLRACKYLLADSYHMTQRAPYRYQHDVASRTSDEVSVRPPRRAPAHRVRRPASRAVVATSGSDRRGEGTRCHGRGRGTRN
ncbi:hypothetical protein C8T65DRAFT_53501 [Cerioporus squamosus]|nr:hypothetical protein C8T65DRAFT_53501 [Cerioporus squamosus]